jgi:hypothetical protein
MALAELLTPIQDRAAAALQGNSKNNHAPVNPVNDE